MWVWSVLCIMWFVLCICVWHGWKCSMLYVYVDCAYSCYVCVWAFCVSIHSHTHPVAYLISLAICHFWQNIIILYLHVYDGGQNNYNQRKTGVLEIKMKCACHIIASPPTWWIDAYLCLNVSPCLKPFLCLDALYLFYSFMPSCLSTM